MRALLKGLWEAETWSLGGWLRAVAFAIFAVTIGYVAIGAGSRNGTAAGLAGSVVVLLLAFGAQWLAELRGANARERRRREEWAEQLLSWPRWKQIAVLTRRCCVRRDDAYPQPSLGIVIVRSPAPIPGGGREQRSLSLSPITSPAASGQHRHILLGHYGRALRVGPGRTSWEAPADRVEWSFWTPLDQGRAKHRRAGRCETARCE